jgi:CheY-like chemotaxis protein
VTNLVGNAVKFTEQGEVVVNVRQTRAGSDAEPAEITISVRDTGVGIAEDRIPLLFTAFSQADTSTTRRYGGSGLGLAISKRLVALMGGDISVESVPGEGSTFRFNVRGMVAPLQPPRDILASGAGKRVLVVDDNATNRRALCGQLALWGFEAKDAAGAGQALDALQRGDRFDLAILDHQMPDVDGMTLAREIRASEACRMLPLILLSSSLVLAKDDPESLFVARILKPARQSSLFDSIMVALGAEAPDRSGAPSPSGTHVIPGALSILVADDNEINRNIARLVLRRFGSEADFVANGRDAVDRVAGHAAADRQKPYDLVFMDVHMPEMDGLEATRAIRQLQSECPARKWPRIVAMTADVMQEDRAICFDAGMDAYLTKPLDFEEVGRVLRQASRSSAQDSAATPAPPAGGAKVGSKSEAAHIVDWSRLDELGEYDTLERAVVKGVISSLADQAPVRLAEIRQSAADRDAAMLRASAHRLKGAASNIGAVALADHASRLESAGKNESFDDVDLLIDELSTTLQTTLDELRRYAERGT